MTLEKAIVPDKRIKDLQEHYSRKKKVIKARLEEFRRVWNSSGKRIFTELCFCICTPQSRAKMCDRAVTGLAEDATLFRGTRRAIRKGLTGVRFPNNKAGYIKEAQEKFCTAGRCRIREHIDPDDLKASRKWLVKNVKGLGYKEASHFLRNIGQGRNLAILDVHIMRNLKLFGLIEKVPGSMSPKEYFRIEQKISDLAGITGITMEELDLVLWSKETGEVFK